MTPAEERFFAAIQHLEAAKTAIEALRVPVFAEQYDGRALSIAITNLETAQLWVANAKRD